MNNKLIVLIKSQIRYSNWCGMHSLHTISRPNLLILRWDAISTISFTAKFEATLLINNLFLLNLSPESSILLLASNSSWRLAKWRLQSFPILVLCGESLWSIGDSDSLYVPSHLCCLYHLESALTFDENSFVLIYQGVPQRILGGTLFSFSILCHKTRWIGSLLKTIRRLHIRFLTAKSLAYSCCISMKRLHSSWKMVLTAN